jgi:hypothetical protein
MFKLKFMAVAAVMACGISAPAFAQGDGQLDEIRKQIEQLKTEYNKQIEALEKRLKDAEQAAATAKEAATTAKETAAKAQTTAAAASQQVPPPSQARPNAFNPAISLILMGTYGNFKNDPTQYGITGFQPPGATSPGDRGFHLGESELFISANADQMFSGAINLAVTDEGVSAEEAYFQTLALGHGLNLKGGRFFSAIGYQNAIHAHAWDFADTSLVQRAFLGENYGDDGVQLTWVAPLPLFVEVGGELGRGRGLVGNFDLGSGGELSSNDRNKNGAGAWSAFLHVGGDVGESNSYRVGLSHLSTSTGTNSFSLADFDTRSSAASTFTNGQVKLYGADFVWKWAPQGNYQYTTFKFIAEWFQIRRDGDLTFDPGGPGELTDRFTQKQSGWYAQAVYQFRTYWRVGLRYDQLQSGSFDGGMNAANLAVADYTPKRLSAMLDWSPSEFSRIRLQYNEDKSLQSLTDHQVLLQYILSLGTHGAHKF